MTPAQRQQIAECKEYIRQGFGAAFLRNQGYAEAAIQIAFGRDPENLDPYGP